MHPLGPGDTLILVDASSYIHKAYFQSIKSDIQYRTRESDGAPNGAIRAFCERICKFVLWGAAGKRPTHLGIVFDMIGGGSFRKDLYPEYKAHRSPKPDDLVFQLPVMHDVCRAFGMEPIEAAGYEADDLIATYALLAQDLGAEVIIVTADKDLMQLVSPSILFYDFESGQPGDPGYRPERILDVQATTERWGGIAPHQIGDALALIGDVSDNVPGVPGIGEKTAVKLISQYGNLRSLLHLVDEIPQAKTRESLKANAETAMLSRRLVALCEDAPMNIPIDDLVAPPIDLERLHPFFDKWGFGWLTRKLEKRGI